MIPNTSIKEIVTVESVAAALEGLHGADKALELANEVVNGEYRKLFAILVLIEKEDSLQQLISESIRDVSLSLKLETSDIGSSLTLLESNSPLSCFSDWDDEELKRFESTQWLVLQLFFTFPEADTDAVQHLFLDRKLVLPILEDTSLSLAQGGYGKVHRVQIHKPDTVNRRVRIRIKML